MAKHTISIALCTYNGEQFIGEQLSSYARQSRLPDCLVAVDDCSTDRTAQILRDFAANAPFRVDVFENQDNLGYIGSFERAISLCGADVIALSDQDDVWREDKLAVMEECFCRRPELSMVFSDAQIVDEAGAPLGHTRWQSVGFTEREKLRFAQGKSIDVLLRHITVLNGCAMAFHAGLKKHALPIPANWSHDAWIAMLAAVTGEVEPIDSPLLQYRQHSGNLAGARIMTLSERQAVARANCGQFLIDELARHTTLCARLETIPDIAVSVRRLIAGKRHHVSVRQSLPRARLGRILPVLGELMSMRYWRYSRGLMSAGLDLIG